MDLRIRNRAMVRIGGNMFRCSDCDKSFPVGDVVLKQCEGGTIATCPFCESEDFFLQMPVDDIDRARKEADLE